MGIGLAHRKWFILLVTVTTTFLIMLISKPTSYYPPTVLEKQPIVFANGELDRNTTENWRNLNKEQINNLSVLGRILYLDEKPPKIQSNDKTYQIMVWKYGQTIENRHLKHFGSSKIDPFEGCSVNNCEITYKDEALKTADIVIFHLHRMVNGDIPKVRGSKQQIWAFLTDESPHHTFMATNDLSKYNSVFNWSMTYRMDSDIPVPYGRTIVRKESINEDLTITKRKDVLVAILGSNCGGKNKRWDYVKQLKQHITVDVYGKCGNLKTCPGHFKLNCHDIDDYLFYLAFENSNCDEYVTEKLWWNAYEKNSIPIVMGGSKDSYKKLLPPDSYLNVEDYATPKDLATHILYLNSTGKYRDYYRWKRDYKVLNEHGYFQSKSYHYCRVCEALNYNKRDVKIYQNAKQFWNVSRDCHPPWNA